MIHPSEIQSLDCITHQNRILFRVLRKLQRGDPNLYLSFVDQRSISPIETASVLLGKFRWFSSIIDLATDLHPVRITGFCFFGRENVRCPLESILPVESIAIYHSLFFVSRNKPERILESMIWIFNFWAGLGHGFSPMLFWSDWILSRRDPKSRKPTSRWL